MLVRSMLGLAALAALGFGGWIATLPSGQRGYAPRPVAGAERDAIVASLKPRKQGRPVIAIVGINDATETTDYLMANGILRRAKVAEVTSLSTGAGPVRLYPVLKVVADSTLAAFDKSHPGGADYVIVPAMEPDHDTRALGWVREQAAKGATIIGVCAGAVVVANAGLLDRKRATTHWYYLAGLRKHHPSVRYIPDRRIVVDGRVATTTGISAAIPLSLALIEAIAGKSRADAVAREIGAGPWDAGHDSSAFRLTRPFALTVLRNRLAFWNHETFGIGLEPGVDEVSLAMVADAWSRTYRTNVIAFGAPVISRSGIRILPDQIGQPRPAERVLTLRNAKPLSVLDGTLAQISEHYGRDTAEIVAMQLEYPLDRAAPRNRIRRGRGE